MISISACLQTHPSSIAMRYVQRQILMGDPNWNEGQYYDISFPRMGMQHARYREIRLDHCILWVSLVFPCWREVGTIAYRSGPEWAQRFGHRRRDKSSPPNFCQDFEIEYYLDKQVSSVDLSLISCISLHWIWYREINSVRLTTQIPCSIYQRYIYFPYCMLYTCSHHI